jgi:hypothetical protein
MYPNGILLVRKRCESTVSPIVFQWHRGGISRFEENTHVYNNYIQDGEIVVESLRCDRDAMWYEDILENHEKYWILDGTYKPLSVPLMRGVQGASKLDWVTVWFLGWNLNETMSPGAAF